MTHIPTIIGTLLLMFIKGFHSVKIGIDSGGLFEFSYSKVSILFDLIIYLMLLDSTVIIVLFNKGRQNSIDNHSCLSITLSLSIFVAFSVNVILSPNFYSFLLSKLDFLMLFLILLQYWAGNQLYTIIKNRQRFKSMKRVKRLH